MMHPDNIEQPRAVRTTASEVKTSYYGQPVIHAPHWGWLISIYFYLGGFAGARFLVAAIADLTGRDRSLARAARYLSLATVIPSPVLLVLDLGRPERALNMFRIIKLRSPMSFGSWALLGLGMFSGAAGSLQLLTDLFGREAPTPIRRTVDLLGAPFAAVIAGYTGVLLAATNVPLWARNYLLLGPTFVASAFSTTLSALSLILALFGDREGSAGREARLQRAEVVCLTTELSLLTAGLLRLGHLGRPLTTGRYGRLFWPMTYLGGLVVPLVLHQTNRTGLGRNLAAVFTLAGGLSLRALMVFAGRESANRPADYFDYTRTHHD